MSRINTVRSAVNEQLNDSHDLLAIRLLFPPDRVEVKIEQEIKDLYAYPERLMTGYRDEWRGLATRALFKNAFADHSRSDQENLQRYLNDLRHHSIPRCMEENIELFGMLAEIIAIARSHNTVAFPDPQRQALMKIIWPERGR